jgi:hypothetical protein
MARLSKVRARATYANVTATLALFAALGGGSFAVAALSGSEKRVVKKIAKKQANKQITARAPGLSVEHASSADSATPAGPAAGDLTGNYPSPTIGSGTVSTAKLADGAVDATKLKDPPLFGYIRDAGGADTPNVEYGRGVTAVDDPGIGHYAVTFDRSMVGCVVQAQQGIGNPSVSGSASTIGPAHADVVVGSSGGASDNQALVTFYNGSNAVADTAFMVTAFC